MTAAVESRPTPVRGPLRLGLVAVPVAAAATMLGAAIARAAGVELEVAGEAIPVTGVGFVTAVFSLLGVGIAVALRRSPDWFVRVAVALLAASLVPPVLADADAGTTVTLVVLHLVAAAVMIPSLTRSLGSRQ